MIGGNTILAKTFLSVFSIIISLRRINMQMYLENLSEKEHSFLNLLDYFLFKE